MERKDGSPKVYTKSHKTKVKIGTMLLEVLDQKPLDKITVQELCDCADIHRSTFYKYFGSIFDTVKFMTEEITGELTAQMDRMDMGRDYADFLVDFYLKYGRALKNLYRTKYRELLELHMSQALEQYYMRLLKFLKPGIEQEVSLELLARYHAAGIMAVGVTLKDDEVDEEWLRRRLPVFYQYLLK